MGKMGILQLQTQEDRMAQEITQPFSSWEVAERRASEYRRDGLLGAYAIPISRSRGWLVAVQPGSKRCESCNGYGRFNDYVCEESDCMHGWIREVKQ